MKQANQEPYDILYARLSQEDDREGESNQPLCIQVAETTLYRVHHSA